MWSATGSSSPAMRQTLERDRPADGLTDAADRDFARRQARRA
jgi:hypothetical protein